MSNSLAEMIRWARKERARQDELLKKGQLPSKQERIRYEFCLNDIALRIVENNREHCQ